MAREAVWHTLAGGVGDSSTWTFKLVDGPGTVQRIIVELGGQHATTGVGQFASFHYVINVGTAAADPNTFGQDPESVMWHGAALIPNTAGGQLATTAPVLAADMEGQRVMGALDSLWLRVDGGAPASGWGWVVSCRVLVLLPEA